MLREGQILVECKSFDITSTLRKVLSSPDPTLGPDDDERVFTHRFRLAGPFGMSPAIGVDESYRFLQNAIEEKRHQLGSSRCNILAFSSSSFGRDAQSLRPALLPVLQDDRNRAISAFLALDRGSDSDETMKSRTLTFNVGFVENACARVPVPPDLAARLPSGTIAVPGEL